LQEHCDNKGYDVSFPQIGSIFWPTFTRKKIKNADEIDGSKMEFFKKLHLLLLQRGIYFGPSGYEVGFISSAHTDADLDFAADKIKESLDLIF
jgi:glutamate-1-semialdehyde 2,1-aminomutase